MKRISAEELLAQNPQADPDKLREGQALNERLKAAGLEGARYALATPLTDKRSRVRTAEKDKAPHRHSMMRRH